MPIYLTFKVEDDGHVSIADFTDANGGTAHGFLLNPTPNDKVFEKDMRDICGKKAGDLLVTVARLQVERDELAKTVEGNQAAAYASQERLLAKIAQLEGTLKAGVFYE